jgi:predicted TPR repeat methyltransferase
VREHPGDRIILRGLSGYLGTSSLPADDATFARELFDGMARDFDAHLQDLGYDMPRQMAEVLGLPALGESRRLDVLDAGCGTGLCAKYLRPAARHLVGVDLSQRMLDLARGKALYDDLYVEDGHAFMMRHRQAFDLVFSSDVLPYVGDPRRLFSEAGVALRPGGRLAVSAERLDADAPEVPGAGFALRPSGRYQHAATFLGQAASEAGFTVEALADATMRLENGKPVAALILVARKSAPDDAHGPRSGPAPG